MSKIRVIASIRYAFSTVGRALIVTSGILVVGFGILSLSSFAMNSGMGQLTAIVLSIALIADFLFLPPLLIKLESMSSSIKQKQSPVTDESVPAPVQAD